jgi:cell division protease FtsH
MDGFESADGVIIIAATNRPDVLEPAILRPGRFDRRIRVPRPDVKGRTAILEVHTREKKTDGNIELEIIARGTPGFAGADLENLVNEAALLAARQDKSSIGMMDIELAKDKVLMGAERRSMVISDAEKRMTAYHEAGHTLVGSLLPNHDPVHKVTIIPRGPALGVTMSLPKEDKRSYSSDWVKDRIAMALGGRIAEELIFDQLTTGASDDFKKATDLARSMVTEWGMSESLGPLAYAENEETGYLGVSSRQRKYSEETAKEIDDEVRRIVQTQYDRAKLLLEENRAKLEELTEALIERETLGTEEIEAILEGRPLPDVERVRIPSYAEKRREGTAKGRERDSDRESASVFQPRPREAPTG